MPRARSAVLVTAFGLLLAAAAGLANPVLVGADPDALVGRQRYWIVATDTGQGPNEHCGQAVFAYADDDLVRSGDGVNDWVRRGPLIRAEQISWMQRQGASVNYLWAPSLLRKGNRYYLYYSIGPQESAAPSLIGVAVGRRPWGPFRDSGAPLPIAGPGFEAIDPMVFVDPKTGTAYLYAGGSAGSRLKVYQLKPSMTEIQGEVVVDTPPNFTEAPFMHERNGTYYLSYSHGYYAGRSYSVHYATASSPLGRWAYQGAILKSDSSRMGPGHHAFFRNPRTDEWFIVYHRWDRTDPTEPFTGMRVIAIDRVSYDSKGLIAEVSMTDDGPPASKLR